MLALVALCAAAAVAAVQAGAVLDTEAWLREAVVPGRVWTGAVVGGKQAAASLVSLGDVLEILQRNETAFGADGTAMVQGRDFRLARTRDGVTTEELLRPVNAQEALQAVMVGGFTLLVNRVERHLPALGQLVDAIEQATGVHAQANVYVTPPQARGFAAHSDIHDVLVVQVQGRKRWTLFAPHVALPLGDAAGQAPGRDEPAMDSIVLGPGDVLHLPRGVGHAVANEDASEPSVHVTVGVDTHMSVVAHALHCAGSAADQAAIRRLADDDVRLRAFLHPDRPELHPRWPADLADALEMPTAARSCAEAIAPCRGGDQSALACAASWSSSASLAAATTGTMSAAAADCGGS